MSEVDRELIDEVACCAVTLVTGLLRCWRRLDAAKNSSDDVEMIQRLSCCEKLIGEECRRLASNSVTDVNSVTLLNADHVLSHLLQT